MRFIYTGETVFVNEHNAVELLEWANYFKCDRLKAQCEDLIRTGEMSLSPSLVFLCPIFLFLSLSFSFSSSLSLYLCSLFLVSFPLLPVFLLLPILPLV